MIRNKLLLVDDEEHFVLTLAERLRLRNCDTRIAINGEDAISEIRKERPDIILLDLKMPGMNGLEILEKIKTEDSTIKVIMLTGHGDNQSWEDVLRAGASDFIVKPFDIENLVAKIQDIRIS